MIKASFVLPAVIGLSASLLVVGCASTPQPAPTSSSSASPTPTPTSKSPTPSPSPSPSPTPTPTPSPVAQGTTRGEMMFVQRAVNAALVAGGDPIRLTLARTDNTVSWFSAPRQHLTGTMRTDSMLRVLGWQHRLVEGHAIGNDGDHRRLLHPRVVGLERSGRVAAPDCGAG